LRYKPGSEQNVTEAPVSKPGELGLFDPPAEIIPKVEYKTIKNTEHNYILVNTDEKINELIEVLGKSESFCFDTETTSLDPLLCDLVGISFCLKPFEAYYVPFSHNRIEADERVAKFKTVFENENIGKTGQNMKYDISVLANYNIKVKGPLFDTMIAHYLIQPDQRHNMDYLSQTYLNYLPVPIENLIGKKGVSQLSMRLVDMEAIKEYSCEDADVTLQLRNVFEPQIKELGLTDLFSDMEMPLVAVLSSMERNGVKIDEKVLKDYAVVLKEELGKFEKAIFAQAGETFNINSPRQLGDILFEKVKISDDAKMTKTKQYSTSEEELMKYAGKHEIINTILEYRSVQKLLNTYVEALPQMVNPRTKKIHTSFNQAVAATGRLSSNNPNLQNIPIRDNRSHEIRRAFVTTYSDYVFLSADYSQVELRLMAHLSNDPAMIEAFVKNEDIHTATAAKINKIPSSEVTREMRSKAKVANFGIIYGISAFGLAQRLNISRTEAKQLIDQYFETYPGVKTYMENSIKQAREVGYVETLFGRRRMLPDINSRNAMVRGMAERNAINAPIQGSAADIIKIAMIKIHRQFENNKLKSKMLLQVHDELDFEVYKNELDQVKQIIKSEMEKPVSLSVPLLVEIGTGANWMEAH
jgi:DNA polymerase-1